MRFYNSSGKSLSGIITNKLIMHLFIVLCIFNFSISGCKEKEFDPPNKTSMLTGNADSVVPVGTAQKMKKYADVMSKAWDPAAVLMEVNGINVGIDGFNQTNLSSSQWIFTYYSPNREVMKDAYI